MKLIFEAQDMRCEIECADDAPRTLEALQRCLPMPLQLHTPKIAGSHIFWHAPFVADVEGAREVMSVGPGAFIYWPVRQFLEITFAPLQAETASVTLLGHVDADVEAIAGLGARLRRDVGRYRFEGRLSPAGNVPEPPRLSPQVPDDLREKRLALWAACPGDIAELTASRAILHPVGPVMQAESEGRVLHEALWWVRSEAGRMEDNALRQTACLLLDKAAVRLRDFCHLRESADILFQAIAAIRNPAQPLEPIIDETILIAGRIAAWIDLLIPWNDLNEAFRAALDPVEKRRTAQ